jgi:hypothetical protein
MAEPRTPRGAPSPISVVGPLARAVWIVAQLVDTAQAVIVYGLYELYEWLRGPT